MGLCEGLEEKEQNQIRKPVWYPAKHSHLLQGQPPSSGLPRQPFRMFLCQLCLFGLGLLTFKVGIVTPVP